MATTFAAIEVPKTGKKPMACRECGETKFWLLTVAYEIYFDKDGGLTFVAPEVDTNLEAGFVCYECQTPCDDFEGAWEFTAKEIK